MTRVYSSLLALFALIASLTACDRDPPNQRPSLGGPQQLVVVRGRVCMDADSSDVLTEEGIYSPVMRSCVQVGDDRGLSINERGQFALVTNAEQNKLAVLSLTSDEPRLADIDLSTPGITHVSV
ncbi:MAG: hypothetical protein AAGI01_16190, partial [Myxococcota bacterium]